jgi:hypothetical protein
MIEPIILSTADCHKFCGSAVIFSELLAIYGNRILKPLRTLPNGSQSWSRPVVLATIALAQSEGSLTDRPRVEAALAKASMAKSIKSQGAPA